MSILVFLQISILWYKINKWQTQLEILYIRSILIKSTSIGVLNFFSMIFSYLSFLLVAFKFYQGKIPFKKYMATYPIHSKSSRLYKQFKPGLFNSQMSINTGISGSSSKIFILPVWNVVPVLTEEFLG